MTEIIEAIAKFVFRFVCQVLLAWTGEIVLFILTFGRHRPRWDLYTRESPGRFSVFSEMSLWIGFAIWAMVAYLLYEAPGRAWDV